MVVMLTVGHGARSTEALLTILTQAGVAALIDIRRFPARPSSTVRA